MAEIKYRKREGGGYDVLLDGEHVGVVWPLQQPKEWLAVNPNVSARFGRRSSAAQWLAREHTRAEREPILPRTEGRGGAK